MADTRGEGSSIFRQSAMSRIVSADDLDKYIKVTNPSAWMVLLAAVLLIGGLIVWAATATIPTTKVYTGVSTTDGNVYCWVDEDTADKIENGKVKAEILETKVEDIKVATMPMSAAEVKKFVGSDYASDSLSLADWNYEVTLTPSDKMNLGDDSRLVPVQITVSETRPIDLIFGTNK